MGDGVRWAEVVADAPEFAQRVRERFDAGVHKTMATLRRDGSPRISGTELEFSDAEVTLGMMGCSLKLADVRRDPRVALLLQEAYRHAKPIGAFGAGSEALELAGIPAAAGVTVGDEPGAAVEQVLADLGRHRVWERFAPAVGAA